MAYRLPGKQGVVDVGCLSTWASTYFLRLPLPSDASQDLTLLSHHFFLSTWPWQHLKPTFLTVSPCQAHPPTANRLPTPTTFPGTPKHTHPPQGGGRVNQIARAQSSPGKGVAG